MKKNCILVTGGCGNIGNALVRRLVEGGDNFVVIIDNLSTGYIENLPSSSSHNWRFIKADVNSFDDISPIMTSWKFDYVFHYAAVVGVKRTLDNPLSVLRDVDGMKNILSLAKNTGVKRVFYSSSSEVYGEPVEIPSSESTTPLNSKLPYAIVKNLSEAYLKSYYSEFGLEYTIFRFFNTYGPRQSEDFVVPKMIKAALQGKPIGIYGDGSQTRTFCFVDDNVEVQYKCLTQNLMVNETLNIGSDIETTIVQLAEQVLQATGGTGGIEYLPPLPEGDMRRRCPDVAKMREVLGRDLVSLDKGIQNLLDYYRQDG